MFSNLLFIILSSSSNTQQMSFGDMIWNGQVWAILRMAEVLIIRDLRKLDLEAVPMMFRLAVIRIKCFVIE